jgi:hypothetical protein
MNDTNLVVRYSHPNLLADGLKNVRIIDFGYNDSGKPRVYGNVAFSNANNSPSGKIYENFEHLKYWVTTVYNYNHFFRTDGVAGDYFVQLLDYNGNIPGLKWFLTPSGMYGTYTNNYSFSGLHRVFFPDGEHEYNPSAGIRFDMISGDRLTFVFGGFTMPINNALLLNGYQAGAGTGEIAPPYPTFNGFVNTPEASVARVTSDTCTKLKAAAGTNTMVYVIKYRSATSTQLDSCGPTGKIKVYSVTSEADLNAKLHEIASDIKSFADYQDPSVGDITP